MLLIAVAELTGTPSMNTEAVWATALGGVKPRMMICWNERSLRPAPLFTTFMPGV
ncbi:hypothetical protein BV97_04607 [Novosphingobium resinovorum]|uniref:Uncharacterized protein n=1 Tax=Novosphingobium resinovorum TaxID=158500 RepID=A0A031JLC8_9SPHN|nr:hypothetical protein BV97_04607 [Novosphingobium resinovorum]